MSFLSLELLGPQLVQIAHEVARARADRQKLYPEFTPKSLYEHLAQESKHVRKTVRVQDDAPCCWNELPGDLWFPLLDTIAQIDLMRSAESGQHLPTGVGIFPIFKPALEEDEQNEDCVQDTDLYFSLLIEHETAETPRPRSLEDSEEKDDRNSSRPAPPRFSMKSGLYLVSAETGKARQIIRLPEHAGVDGLMRITTPTTT
jgi:hypothetical protein